MPKLFQGLKTALVAGLLVVLPAPTPMAGAILIMPGERVHPIDVPIASILACVSKWGTGAGELLAAMNRNPGSQDPLALPARPA